ncbi:MAG: type I secretion system permease/ATPase [Pseudomonadota bacterium]
MAKQKTVDQTTTADSNPAADKPRGQASVSLLSELARRCAPGLAASFTASFFTTLCLLALPLYMFQTFDRVLGSGNENTLIALTLLALGFMVVYGFIEYGRSRIHTVLANWTYQRLNLDSLQAMVTGSLNGEARPAEIMRDIGELRRFVAGKYLVAAFEAIWSVLFIIVAFLLHPLFGFITLIGIGGLIALAILNQVLASKPIADSREASAASNAHLNAAMRNAEIIEGLGLVQAIGKRWQRAEQHNLEVGERGMGRAGKVSAISKSFRLIIQVFALGAAASLILNGAVSPGVFIAIMVILARALQPFEQLIDGWGQWVSAGRAYRRLETVLAKPSAARATMVYPRPSGQIDVERLVYIPPGMDNAVLRGVSFAIQPGQALGIIGPSAAGKSTLLRLMMGVVRPNVGAVRFDGQDVTQWAREDLGQYLGYVPQEPALFEGTVRENIARMTEADPLAVIEAAKRADVHDIIGRLPGGYDTFLGQGGAVLTGGQKQRIALARALFGRPSIMLLDEPDANLDREGEAALKRTIRQIKMEGTTVICVSHRRSVLDEMDSLLLLESGTVRRMGSRDEILPILDGKHQPAAIAGKPDIRALPSKGQAKA